MHKRPIAMEIDPFLAIDQVATPAANEAVHAHDATAQETTASSDGGGAAHDASAAAAPPQVEAAKSAEAEDPVASLLAPPAPARSSTKTKAASSGSGANKPGGKTTTPEDLNEELATLLLTNQLPQSSVTALQNLLRENASLKEKNNKLKSLLGRSAKAQRDAKNELEQMKKMYEATRAENDRLEKRVEVLANRPTHMDLLADFETNFDRALLSIGGSDKKSSSQQQQSGGENAAESSSSSAVMDASNEGMSLYDEHVSSVAAPSSRRVSGMANDSLLLTELNEAKSRIAHLESLNTSFQGRYNNLEHTHRSLMNEQQSSKNTLTNLQLELRMSKMETEHALRSLREKEAIVAEMQLEINLVTQSAVEANKRAAEGMEVMQSAKSDREYVDGLEAKVVALQEWALASTESKRLTAERCMGLEGRVRELEGVVKKLTASGQLIMGEDGDEFFDEIDMVSGAGGPTRVMSSGAISVATTGSSLGGDDNERKLWTKSSSLVVGAGMAGHALFELGQAQIEPYETVILRWKFDLTPGDLDIYFSVLKGIHEDKRSQRGADACFRNRHVKGGGGGDVSGAFAKQNACTLVWSNEKSWVRPRTIKWTVEAVAIEWTD